MDAGGDDVGAVGLLNVGMIRIFGVGAVEGVCAPEGEGAAGDDGVVAERFEIVAQADARLEQLA